MRKLPRCYPNWCAAAATVAAYVSQLVRHWCERCESAAAPDASMYAVPQKSWRAVEHLIALAALELAETPAIDEEVKTWTRLTERSQDGVPATNWQRTSEQTAGAPVVQRDFAQGRPVPGSAVVGAQPEGDPLLAVLLTAADTSADWIAAGRSLMRVALVAQSAGMALGYVNQPTEVVGMREKLADLFVAFRRGFGVPQLVLRLGYPGWSPCRRRQRGVRFRQYSSRGIVG